MRRPTLPAALALVLAVAAPAGALELPSPAEQRAQDVQLLREVGARADRVLVSVVPGPVVNDEVVLVLLDGSGTPQRVLVEQRLALSGTGDYQVRERGPARASEALGEEPAPVTKFGAVVWQGFSPGARDLAARLTLDPVLEAPRLPLQVTAAYDGGPLGPGGAVPAAGTVLLRLTNTTTQPATLPAPGQAPAAEVAAALDAARAAAGAPLGTRLPAAGQGLPTAVGGPSPARVSDVTGVPLRITGAVRAVGAQATVTGPATTPVPGGAQVLGTLPAGASAELAVEVDGPAVLELDLAAAPALDPRVLVPPAGARTWAQWAAAGPSAAQRRDALALLVQVAATGARATSYSPYLGADLPGTGTTVFRYAFAAPEQAERVARALTPRPGAIALAGVALLLLAGNGVLLWRRS